MCWSAWGRCTQTAGLQTRRVAFAPRVCDCSPAEVYPRCAAIRLLQVHSLRELSNSVVSHYFWGAGTSSGVQPKHVRVCPFPNARATRVCPVPRAVWKFCTARMLRHGVRKRLESVPSCLVGCWERAAQGGCGWGESHHHDFRRRAARGLSAGRACSCCFRTAGSWTSGCGSSTPPLPPSRTKWTRLVPPSVLIGHVSSLLRYCDKLRLRKGRPLKREVGAAARPRGLRRRRARADGAPAARAGDAAVLREAARLRRGRERPRHTGQRLECVDDADRRRGGAVWEGAAPSLAAAAGSAQPRGRGSGM